jgi:succinate dehydrogenase / fumarate reductase cytochrome b subunit
MWLTSSSIGRKVVMSVTGTALILFLTFHMAMNLVYIFSPEGYNTVCEFLGANWYAVAATGALALLFVIHIIYAFWLNLQNHRARGHERYAVSGKQPIEWSSKNMLALGVIVILGLLLHFFNFWYNMMFAELSGIGNQELAANGSHYIAETFKCPVYVILYVIWIAALWFHLNHGFWSAMQTLGWSGKIWLNRWICISRIYSTLICLGFLAVLLAGVLRANCGACC